MYIIDTIAIVVPLLMSPALCSSSSEITISSSRDRVAEDSTSSYIIQANHQNLIKENITAIYSKLNLKHTTSKAQSCGHSDVIMLLSCDGEYMLMLTLSLHAYVVASFAIFAVTYQTYVINSCKHIPDTSLCSSSMTGSLQS